MLTLLLAACVSDGASTTSTTEPSETTTSDTATTTSTVATTTTESTTTTAPEADLGPIYAITFSEEATGVVRLDGNTGEIIHEVTGAIGEGSDSLDYIRERDSLIYSRVVTAAMSEVVEVPADGGEPTVLTTGSAADATDDGTHLAVARLELVDGGPDQMVLEVRDFEGNVINTWSDDTTPEEEVFIQNLAWSPDGSQLAFEIRFEDGTEVFVLDPDARSGSIEETASVVEPDTEDVMLSAPFWLSDDQLGVVAGCCDPTDFDSWEAVVVDPATGERQSSLFTVDYPISEVDVHANGDEIAFISSHDAFGSGTTGPDELKVWTPDHGILDIREEQSSVGW